MNNAEQRKQWLEAMHAGTPSRDRFFQLVASLTGVLDRDAVVETIETVVGVKSVERDDCVYFDDIGLRFGDDGRVKSVFQTIRGPDEDVES